MEKAAELQYGKLPQLKKQLEDEEAKVKDEDRDLVHESVTDDEIAKIVSRWTGIPVAKLNESERSKTLHLADELHKRVIGQDEGVELVTEASSDPKPELKIQPDRLVRSCSLDLPESVRQNLQRHLQRACLMMRITWCVST